MMLNILLVFTIFISTSPSLAASSSAPRYDRTQCDNLIGVNSYIQAGSLDDDTPGGKVYRFESIITSLQHEIRQTRGENQAKFTCLADFFEKAHNDSNTYWDNRLARSTCADSSGMVPKVQPDGCDDQTWEEYHRSKATLEKSLSDATALANECVEIDGVASCGQRVVMQDVSDFANSIARSESDQCCDMKEGPAFRVLRGFYTFEFGKMPDAELQKECYKRTRPNPNGQIDSGFAVNSCIKGLYSGVLESFRKMGSSLLSLVQAGTLSEIWRVVSQFDMETIGKKLAQLVQAIYTQVSAQANSMGCFKGPYAADHFCKLTSSLVTDWFTGAGIAKGLAMFGKLLTTKGANAAAIAKEMINSSPKQAAALKASVQSTSAGIKKGATTVVSGVKSASSAFRTSAGARLTSLGKALKEKRKDSAQSVVNLREKLGIRLAGNDRLIRNPASPSSTLRGSSSVELKPNAPALRAENSPSSSSTNASTSATNPTASSSATSSIGSSASSTVVKKTGNDSSNSFKLTIDSSVRDLKRFERINKNSKNPEQAFVKPSQLRRKSNAEKLKLVEDIARNRKAQVSFLENTATGQSRISSTKALLLRENIDTAVAQYRTKLGFNPASPRLAPAGSTSGSAITKTGQSDSLSGSPSPTIKTEVPTNAPSSVNQPNGTAIIGSSGNAVSEVTATIPSFNYFDAFQPGYKFSSSAAENTWKSLSPFIEKTQNIGSTGVKTSVYGNKSRLGVWIESRRRHHEVQDLLRRGDITPETADALHNIVESSERLARNAKPTKSAVVSTSPNAGPSTFSSTKSVVKKASGVAAKAAIRGAVVAPLTNAQFNRYSDSKTNNRYDDETILLSMKTVEQLLQSTNEVEKSFEGLTTEGQILDRADKLRAQIKTVEITAGPNIEETDRSTLINLLNRVDSERNKALNKIKGISTTPSAAVSPEAKIDESPAPEADVIAPEEQEIKP